MCVATKLIKSSFFFFSRVHVVSIIDSFHVLRMYVCVFQVLDPEFSSRLDSLLSIPGKTFPISDLRVPFIGGLTSFDTPLLLLFLFQFPSRIKQLAGVDAGAPKLCNQPNTTHTTHSLLFSPHPTSLTHSLHNQSIPHTKHQTPNTIQHLSSVVHCFAVSVLRATTQTKNNPTRRKNFLTVQFACQNFPKTSLGKSHLLLRPPCHYSLPANPQSITIHPRTQDRSTGSPRELDSLHTVFHNTSSIHFWFCS